MSIELGFPEGALNEYRDRQSGADLKRAYAIGVEAGRTLQREEDARLEQMKAAVAREEKRDWGTSYSAE